MKRTTRKAQHKSLSKKPVGENDPLTNVERIIPGVDWYNLALYGTR